MAGAALPAVTARRPPSPARDRRSRGALAQPLHRSPPVDGLIGRRITSYKVLALVEEGGMGRVYAATHLLLGRRTALKLLPPDALLDPRRRARFQEEARLMAALEHPNVVRIFDVGETDEGQPFIAMEWLSGKTLGEWIRRVGAFPRSLVLETGVQLARALGAIHAAGLVHRDVKPNNVMVLDRAPRGAHVKLLDFGLARPLEREEPLTREHELLGTPRFIAPEIALGEAPSPRSDLYGLGVVLYMMLAGEPPFDGPDLMAITAAQLEQAPPVPPGWGALGALLVALLSPDPSRRPCSAEALGRSLLALLPGEALERGPEPTLIVPRAHAGGAPEAPTRRALPAQPAEPATLPWPSDQEGPPTQPTLRAVSAVPPGAGLTPLLPPGRRRAHRRQAWWRRARRRAMTALWLGVLLLWASLLRRLWLGA